MLLCSMGESLLLHISYKDLDSYHQIPIVYCFFPETGGLELEDVDHLFEKGGITGGVFSSRGYPVTSGYHRAHPNTEGIEKTAAFADHV